jgi:hypothetical protein
MNPEIKNANTLDKLLAQLEASRPAPPEKDEVPSPFVFSDARDKQGCVIECLDYAKRSCNRCLGRGYVVALIGDGYKAVDGKKVKRLARDQRACVCVVRGYARAKKRLDSLRAVSVKALEGQAHAEADATRG